MSKGYKTLISNFVIANNEHKTMYIKIIANKFSDKFSFIFLLNKLYKSKSYQVSSGIDIYTINVKIDKITDIIKNPVMKKFQLLII